MSSVIQPFSEPSNFRPSDEIIHDNSVTNPPHCIVALDEHTDNKRSDLTNQQLETAKEELENKSYLKLNFPRTTKLHKDPPIEESTTRQLISLHSFIPSKGAKPDLEGCYGVLKVRGCWESEQDADRHAEKILRECDSYAVIDYSWVGRPFPLMDNNLRYRAKTAEIDLRKVVDSTYRDDLKKKRDQEKLEQQELLQRQRELERDVREDKSDMIDADLDFYTTLRTKAAHIRYTLDELIRKRKEYEDNLEMVLSEIKEADKKNPEYKDQFLEKYKAALASSGITETGSSLLKYMCM